MTLTLLPEEVLEEIVKQLSVKDLLACSAVSLEWRERFNVDSFWKKYCFRDYNDYLEDTPCEVKPAFSPPENYGERLLPLCEGRVQYMRSVHLLNNWKSLRYSSFEFRAYEGVISGVVQIDRDKTHWLFLKTKSEIEVWNITTIPQFLTSIYIFSNCLNVNIFVAGKRFFITQWNIVSVYDLESSQEKSLCRFLIEDDIPLPLAVWDSIDKTEVVINEEDDFRFANFGTLLVGYKRLPNPSTDLSMHIWDTTLGKKLRIECLLNYLGDENDVCFINIYEIDDKRGLIRIAFLSPQKEMCSKLFIYDFGKLTLTETNIKFVGVAVWCGCAQDIVVTFSSNPGGTFKFHHYPSGKLLFLKEIGEYTNTDQVQIVNSLLLYCTFNCLNVLDIVRQEVVYCLQFGFYAFVRRLTVIEPRFVVVWMLERGSGPGYPSFHQEVWDVKDFSCKLLQCSSELGLEMVTACPSLVKQVVAFNGNLCLYTFW